MSKKILFLAITSIAAIFILGILYTQKFHITQTSPALSGIYNSTPYLDIQFNKSLSSTGIQLSSSPKIIQNYSIVGTKTLRLTWSSPLIAAQKYTITIESISSAGGSRIKNKQLVFSVKPSSKLSSAEQQAVVNSQDNGLAADKINSLLPHYDPSYKLEAQPNGNNKPNIIFTYLPPPIDMQSTAPDKTSSITAAKAWLSQNGIDLSQYTLIDVDSNQKIN